MGDTNITIKEYIRIEEDKAQRGGLVFNWKTAKFGRTEHYYEEECFSNFKEEFPAIVFGEINSDSFNSKQGGGNYPPNDSELDFKISCDESDDEDYTVIFNENSFSYKIVAVNDLKIVSENDDNNVALSHNPKVDHDLDYFNDFENEFPAIVYNDGLTSNSDLVIKTPVSTDKTDEIEPIDETSFSEGQDMAPLPAADQRHLWLRYQVPGYTHPIVHSYEQRLATIWSRPVNRIHVLDFVGITDDMIQD
ncbi:hypothetical protein Tco_0870914 [Tanacetum coccineum]